VGVGTRAATTIAVSAAGPEDAAFETIRRHRVFGLLS
jgi:hypothetical protein